MPSKIKTAVFGLLLMMLLLCGCTSHDPSPSADGLLPHLSVDLQITTRADSDNNKTFSVAIEHNEQPFQDADRVQFEIFPENDPEAVQMVEGHQTKPGLYEASQKLDKGLYVVTCRVHSKDYQVMPSRYFAIGNEAVEKLTLIEQSLKGDAVQTPDGGGHHHH